MNNKSYKNAKKLTPFQRYKLRIETRIGQLELLDKTTISSFALSQAERWELAYLGEVLKDIKENVLGDEELFARDCFYAGAVAEFKTGCNENEDRNREEDFYNFYRQYDNSEIKIAK